ncbi:hypothetical protein L7F22_038650 [Adiantum nelumboides]|nr:hypothetical protein [Adiantum nelumboides]
MIRAVSAHSEDTRTEILTNEEINSIFKGCNSYDLMVESTTKISSNSKFDEEVNTGSSSTPTDNLSWREEDPSEDQSIAAPKHFKSYTTGDHKVVYTKTQKTPINGSSGVYNGPIIVKEIELAKPDEESKPVIAQDLTKIEEAMLKELLKEFKDIFAWTYHDMKRVPPSVVQHTIPMSSTAKPVQQRPYPTNPKYAKIVQEKLEKLIKCGSIYSIKHLEWVSPIVIVPKKNGKLRVCVDHKKVNAATRRDHYPLPYSKHVLKWVAGKEAYSCLDGYSGCNQITIALGDQAKIAFITKFGVFTFRIMAFGLTNAPATFQQLINTAFKEYLREFCEAFLNDLCIYFSWEEHCHVYERWLKSADYIVSH